MAPALSWLSTCKSSQLKAVATATGLNSTGTKAVLVSQLLEHLCNGYNRYGTTNSISKDYYDIISIDMGIRNLAYCRLTSAPLSKAVDFRSPQYRTPLISEWARIDISGKAPKLTKAENAETKEAFDPATYSQHAYNLVKTLLSSSPNKPTQILIERQRFRSMGGSAVQEWTLRVNMFEAMIYAVLKTFSETGTWQGTVHPIAPAKVSKFWLGDKEDTTLLERGGSKSARTKTAKIDLVGKWLKEREAGGHPFQLEGKAEMLAMAYLLKRNRGKSGRLKQEGADGRGMLPANVGKLDDLADCMLQGMAWIRWEQNRRLIMSKGLEAMDEIV